MAVLSAECDSAEHARAGYFKEPVESYAHLIINIKGMALKQTQLQHNNSKKVVLIYDVDRLDLV